jgi:phospholipid transport system substrate-binding protein
MRPPLTLRRRSLLLACLAPLLTAAGPADPIAAFNAALLAGMKAGGATPFAQRAASLAPAVDAAFDLPAILRATIGPRWSAIPPAQQDALLAAFRDYTLANWVANFDSFEGQRFEVAPTTRKVGADQVVETRIVPASGAPTRLDYVMRNGDAGWKAVDVLVDGAISRVAVQRSDFRALLRDGDASALIATLNSKTASLAGGATG